MTVRPIIFSGPMVRALLDGRKTQTRRLATSPLRKCEPGDLLYVREGWALHSRASDVCTVAYMASVGHVGWTKAHEQFPDHLAAGKLPRPFQDGWRPSIHMPRWASRITLKLEAVRVESLQSISDEDAIAEGIREFPCEGPHRGPDATYWTAGEPDSREPLKRLSPASAYHALWDHLHGEESWSANPDVMVLTFRPLAGNVDRIAA